MLRERATKPRRDIGLVAGLIGIVAIVACSGNQSTDQTSKAVNSVHLSAQGANYIGAESRLLAGYAIGVGKGKITPSSRVAVSGSNNGIKASGEVWSGASLRTAKGFSLDYTATYANQSGVKQLHASGNVFIARTTPGPSLTAVLVGGQQQGIELMAAMKSSGTTFNVGSDSGGQVVFNGDQLTYTDSQGKVAAQHTFASGDALESKVKGVMDANVPSPSAALVKQACQGSAVSVANSQVFSLSIDDESSKGHLSIISVIVTKNVQVDCKTNQVSTSTFVDVSGDSDGKGFLAISSSPSVADTATEDNTPAPTEPALTSFTPDPLDANALPLPLATNGQIPSFDGNYTGSYSAGGSLKDGTKVAATGAFELSVAANAITMSAPGSGSGGIDVGGGAAFSFTIPGNGSSTETSTCSLVGSFTNVNGSKSASGTMSCTWADGNAGGPWNATAK